MANEFFHGFVGGHQIFGEGPVFSINERGQPVYEEPRNLFSDQPSYCSILIPGDSNGGITSCLQYRVIVKNRMSLFGIESPDNGVSLESSGTWFRTDLLDRAGIENKKGAKFIWNGNSFGKPIPKRDIRPFNWTVHDLIRAAA